MKQSLRWEHKRLIGIKMLRSIAADENELKAILGDYYPVVLQSLQVQRITENAIMPASLSGHDQITVTSGSVLRVSVDDDREPPPKKRKTMLT